MLCFKLIILFSLFSLFFSPAYSIRSFPLRLKDFPQFKEAPTFSNGHQCPSLDTKASCDDGCDSYYSTSELKGQGSRMWPGMCHGSSDATLVHVAMTLDGEYLRGSTAAIHSVLNHTSCPENVYFHFIASDSHSPYPDDLTRIIKSTFPSLLFKVYPFSENRVKNLISSSIRQALESPLNYARIYLADIIEPCVNRVIYLDSDTIAVDDIKKLWSTTLDGSRVIGAPEYCHVNFTRYFTNEFWLDQKLSRVFEGKRPCYFNTGVMVMDMARWREGDYTTKIEKWMEVQRVRRVYDLGSLPPFLLVFGGDIEAIDHRWNQHGLGGDNVVHSCRSLHPGPVSLLHWSGKGKPWVRLDEGRPCPVDHFWAPYDLYRGNGLSRYMV